MILFETGGRIDVPNPIVLEVFDPAGTLMKREVFTNSRTQAGGIAVASAQFGGTGVAFKYVGLSSNASLAPANTDTTLSSEITTVGLGRVLGIVTVGTTQTALNGSCLSTVTASWTASGPITVYGAGLFSALAGGVLGYEGVCTATPVANGYVVNLSWGLNE